MQLKDQLHYYPSTNNHPSTSTNTNVHFEAPSPPFSQQTKTAQPTKTFTDLLNTSLPGVSKDTRPSTDAGTFCTYCATTGQENLELKNRLNNSRRNRRHQAKVTRGRPRFKSLPQSVSCLKMSSIVCSPCILGALPR